MKKITKHRNIKQIARQLGADKCDIIYKDDLSCGIITFNTEAEVSEAYHITDDGFIFYEIIYTVGDRKRTVPLVMIDKPIELWINTFKRGLYMKPSFWRYGSKYLRGLKKYHERRYNKLKSTISYKLMLNTFDECYEFDNAKEYFKFLIQNQ